ncbi:nucleopolyhedrovirus P10 family protein [Streptomyces endophyticus]|uniref:Nucleopolyhedrovirus P10 family protein n=1 Tax=Streptomyces endophyticus TaxID=714166 RepID=A0ABU6F842_9ACTN|nr:nucleopolyhedrovirus P10 family protein [Streptomyces endophyticus]MEB8338967.1 nucleopolyhedrovirus P10 family protein [Streptomyces endophyticus]
MTADGWTQAVRTQLGLGRLLPLGGPQDGAWLTEPAAAQALRRAAQGMRGVRLGALRLGLADPDTVAEPAVPAPPSALPPGPLRLTADCAATADEPLPVAAERLREALAEAAEWVGLVVTEVDLQVTALLDEADQVADAEPGSTDEPDPAAPKPTAPSGDAGRAAEAALAVPGVSRLTGALGGLGRAIHIEEQPGEATLPRRHVRVELAVAADTRAIEVAGAVRTAVAKALPNNPTVAVLITELTT